MGYKPSHMVAWEKSPKYAVIKYRSPEAEAKTDFIEELTNFIQYDEESLSLKQTENLLKFLKPIFDQFVSVDMEKVKAGEQELLDQWIKACKG